MSGTCCYHDHHLYHYHTVNFYFIKVADYEDFTGSMRQVHFSLYGLYVLEGQEETLLYRRVNGFRLNISQAKCITTTVLYVEDDRFLECDTVRSDTKLHVVTCHTSAVVVEAVGSSETLESTYQTA